MSHFTDNYVISGYDESNNIELKNDEIWPFVINGSENLIFPTLFYGFEDTGNIWSCLEHGFQSGNECERSLEENRYFRDHVRKPYHVSYEVSELGKSKVCILRGDKFIEEMIRRDVLNDVGHFTKIESTESVYNGFQPRKKIKNIY